MEELWVEEKASLSRWYHIILEYYLDPPVTHSSILVKIDHNGIVPASVPGATTSIRENVSCIHPRKNRTCVNTAGWLLAPHPKPNDKMPVNLFARKRGAPKLPWTKWNPEELNIKIEEYLNWTHPAYTDRHWSQWTGTQHAFLHASSMYEGEIALCSIHNREWVDNLLKWLQEIRLTWLNDKEIRTVLGIWQHIVHPCRCRWKLNSNSIATHTFRCALPQPATWQTAPSRTTRSFGTAMSMVLCGNGKRERIYHARSQTPIKRNSIFIISFQSQRRNNNASIHTRNCVKKYNKEIYSHEGWQYRWLLFGDCILDADRCVKHLSWNDETMATLCSNHRRWRATKTDGVNDSMSRKHIGPMLRCVCRSKWHHCNA